MCGRLDVTTYFDFDVISGVDQALRYLDLYQKLHLERPEVHYLPSRSCL